MKEKFLKRILIVRFESIVNSATTMVSFLIITLFFVKSFLLVNVEIKLFLFTIIHFNEAVFLRPPTKVEI